MVGWSWLFGLSREKATHLTSSLTIRCTYVCIMVKLKRVCTTTTHTSLLFCGLNIVCLLLTLALIHSWYIGLHQIDFILVYPQADTKATLYMVHGAPKTVPDLRGSSTVQHLYHQAQSMTTHAKVGKEPLVRTKGWQTTNLVQPSQKGFCSLRLQAKPSRTLSLHQRGVNSCDICGQLHHNVPAPNSDWWLH
jgi:hypothetical protein